MKRTVVVYGVVGGLLIAALKLIEYRFVLVEHSFQIYGAIVAVVFSAVGIWLGLKLTRTRETVVATEVLMPTPRREQPFTVDAAKVERFGITPRELEILGLIADGLSNREIAERLYVSENTVKTHSSRLFDKLDARRRTQAVQIAKSAGLLP